MCLPNLNNKNMQEFECLFQDAETNSLLWLKLSYSIPRKMPSLVKTQDYVHLVVQQVLKKGFKWSVFQSLYCTHNSFKEEIIDFILMIS